MTDWIGVTLWPYRITERIGRGGMADVFKALQTSFGVPVYRAVKIVRADLSSSDDFQTRFQKEADALVALPRHQNIVQVLDYGSHEGGHYMVMEYVEGLDLKRLLSAEKRIRPIARAVDIVMQIADALDHAHRHGLIHRDVKPGNVMITPEGRSILMDFGIAKLVSATRITQVGLSLGTPAYMSPEQVLADPRVGPATDIYALSVVLFELLTGDTPWSADTPIAMSMKILTDRLPMPRDLAPDVGEELQRVIMKGTAKRPEDRYASAVEFRDALGRALARDVELQSRTTRVAQVATTPRGDPTSTTRSHQWLSDGKLWRVRNVVASLLLAGLTLAWYVERQPSDTETKTQALDRCAEAVASWWHGKSGIAWDTIDLMTAISLCKAATYEATENGCGSGGLECSEESPRTSSSSSAGCRGRTNRVSGG